MTLKTTRWNLADHLDTPEAIALFLEAWAAEMCAEQSSGAGLSPLQAGATCGLVAHPSDESAAPHSPEVPR